MREALAGTPERLPKRPPGIVEIRINPETGKIANDRTPNTIFEKFDIGHLPEREEQSSVDPSELLEPGAVIAPGPKPFQLVGDAMGGRRRSSPLPSDLRQQLAEEAARLISEHGIQDFALAKRKAAERLGVRAQAGALPSNEEIQERLIERQRIFEPEGARSSAREAAFRGDGHHGSAR